MLQVTRDADFIRSIVTHPEVWPFAVDEGGDPETWLPTSSGIWLTCDGVAGVVLVYRVSGAIWAYDAALLPQSRGDVVGYKERRGYIELLKAWLRENVQCKRLIAFIARDNERSIRAAEADGLGLEGIIPASKRRGDGWVDSMIYGCEV